MDRPLRRSRYCGFYVADLYNFQRPNQGIDGLVPADRFFGAAPEVLQTLKARVAPNALEVARHGRPSNPFYLTGQVGGQPFSVHAEGERVILTGAQGRREVDLVPPAQEPAAAAMPQPICPAGVVQSEPGWEETPEPAPGTSPLDGVDELVIVDDEGEDEPVRLEGPSAPPESAKGGDA